IASFIILYFLAGWLTVDPYLIGIYKIANYGCYAQGLIIPHQHLDALGAALQTAPNSIAGNSFIESYADRSRLKKYTITPSVLQHVRIKGSSDAEGTKKLT
ncbi:hypothetical protein BKA59DRAFT_409402, partial [Fusarium tricinctum]